jgi:hypothetical protein
MTKMRERPQRPNPGSEWPEIPPETPYLASYRKCAVCGDASDRIGKLLNFYNPVGTLSGVTTVAIIVWLVSWFILNQQWRTKAVDLAKVNVVAFIGLAIGLLLTFPPFMDLLQGK